MFELYARGMTCEDIHQMEEFRGLRLGQIVRARIEGDWVNRYKQIQQDLYDRVQEKVKGFHVQTANLLADVLEDTYYEYEQKRRKYIATGDSQHLPFQVKSIKDLKVLVETMKTLIEGNPQHQVNLFVSGEGTTAQEIGEAAKKTLLESRDILNPRKHLMPGEAKAVLRLANSAAERAEESKVKKK